MGAINAPILACAGYLVTAGPEAGPNLTTLTVPSRRSTCTNQVGVEVSLIFFPVDEDSAEIGGRKISKSPLMKIPEAIAAVMSVAPRPNG